MSLRDDWINTYLPEVFEELSEDVQYLSSGSILPAVTIPAIFHRDYVSLKVSGGMAIESSKPVFIVQDSVVTDPKAGDQFTFDSLTYKCVEVQRTRGGVTVMLMDRGA